jgi:hypothetical protein
MVIGCDGNNKARQNNWSCDGYPWVNKGGYGVPKKNPIVFARKYTLRQHSGDLTTNMKNRNYIIN